MGFSLGTIARRFELQLRGDAQRRVIGVCGLTPGVPDRISFMVEPRLRGALATTRAGAVIVGAGVADDCPVPALIAADPALAFARVAALFVPRPTAVGIASSAVVDPGARVDAGAVVGPCAVIEADAEVGAGAVLEAGCAIGRGAVVGAAGWIGANAVVGTGVRLGARVCVGPGAILGGRGFGLVRDGEAWLAMPQLGGVLVGDDVEIGAGCTIDRGSIDDTVLEAGVKLDDQVHIAHNCRIGAHTVIAGCTGIAGSCDIGRRCMIGGGVGIGDHVRIADDVVLTGATQVPGDIRAAGVYSSTLKAMPAADWRRRLAWLRKLDRIDQRLRRLEGGARNRHGNGHNNEGEQD